ncbi:MAG: SDR family NAD(P)-dependent oxidoreductase [Clostridia bacterium]|nr:SDR family NAD(P)-dependent oxidoreductase [Clostridia bacterium]
MEIAIITGTSSGLGKEFLKQIYDRYSCLDEIWIISRRESKLFDIKKSIEKENGPVIIPMALDLTDEDSCLLLSDKLNRQKPNIRVLINNAGCGVIGDVLDADYKAQANMVDINVRALTVITTLVLKYMKPGKTEGTKTYPFIINVCSIASFAPNPRMSVYCSTKAYVMSYTKALNYELKSRFGKNRINVLAVCPGPMRTEFLEVAGIAPGTSKTFDILPYCIPEKVAQKAVKRAEKGKTVYTPRLLYKIYRIVAKILPHNWIMPVSKT